MKTTALIILTILTTSLAGVELSRHEQPAIVSNDRQFLLDYFQQTTDQLKKSVEGLSKEQMQFKPAADRWSVSECVEHIILTEKALFDLSSQLMEKPANPERRKEINIKDEQLISGIIDRSKKAKATPELQGEGVYTDPANAMEDFIEARQVILEYIRKTPVEEMRNHIDDSPFGAIDGYQSFLFISGHTARHTLQIEEVKNSAGFPK